MGISKTETKDMKRAKTSTVYSSGIIVSLLTAALIGLSLAPFPAWSAAALVTVPSAYWDTEGDQGRSIPFGTDNYCDDGIRYQQLYDGSQVGGPTIGSMSFRLDSSSGDVGPVNYTGVTVTLSSTLATYATMSTTFADNIGPNAAIVYSGNLSVDPSTLGSPNPFDFTINFDTPFEFDGSVANLLVDITITGCHEGSIFHLDAVGGENAVSRIWAQDKDDLVSEEAVQAGTGLVTEFYIYSGGVVFIPYSMGAGGNWAIDGHNGEGFLFEPLANGQVVIFWFTYDLFGNQMWLVGVTNPGDFITDPGTGDDVATVHMYRTGGPSFGPGYNPADYAEDLMGTVTFRLHGCQQSAGATGEVDYNLDFGFGIGSYNITKLYDIYKNDCTP